MKSVVIYYFSGTGNTEIIANMLKDGFSTQQYTVDLIRIEDVLKNNLKIDSSKYDLMGIGSQIIGYAAPTIVKDFIQLLPKENNQKVFIFRSAGGVAPINYNASKSMIRKLSRKGYPVFYERVFSIASNWIVKYNDDIVLQLHEATKRKVNIMCEEILRGEVRILKTSVLRKILMELVMFTTPPFFRLVGKDYTVDQSCNQCGFCVRNCPAENIIIKNGQIKFKMSCNSCMRCVYSCPQKAIQFRLLRFFPIKGGYNIKKTLEHPCSDHTNKAAPPFFHGYINDDSL